MQSYQSSGGYSAWSQKSAREAAREERALEREAKQRAKRDQLEAARVEVDEAERKLSELLSVHKNCAPKVDWIAETAALCPAETNAFVSGDRRDWRRKRVQLPLEDVGIAPCSIPRVGRSLTTLDRARIYHGSA
jgi:hypothetical protein